MSLGAATFSITIFSVMRLFSAPPTGLLVQRLGERRVYVAGLLIVSVSTATCAFAQTYWQLLVFRAIGGIGSTMFFISALGLMIRISPADARGRVAGLFVTSFLIGSVAGPLVGSLTAGLGLKAPFLIYGVSVLITAIVVSYSLRRSTLGAPAEHAEPAVTVRAALRHRAYRAALLSNFATGWAVFGLRMAIVPLFVSDVLGRGPRMTGLVLGMFALGNLSWCGPAAICLTGWPAQPGDRRAPRLRGGDHLVGRVVVGARLPGRGVRGPRDVGAHPHRSRPQLPTSWAARHAPAPRARHFR